MINLKQNRTKPLIDNDSSNMRGCYSICFLLTKTYKIIYKNTMDLKNNEIICSGKICTLDFIIIL